MKLNLQLFAEDQTETETQVEQKQNQTETETQVEQKQNQTETETQVEQKQTQMNIDLDSILAKRIPSLVKNILKDNGFDEDYIKTVVEKYKSTETKSTDIETELKNQISDLKFKSTFLEESFNLGLDMKSAKHLSKLIDRSNLVDEGGEIILEKLREEINTVLEDFPALKPLENGFVKIGTTNNKDNNYDPLLALKNAMGLK